VAANRSFTLLFSLNIDGHRVGATFMVMVKAAVLRYLSEQQLSTLTNRMTKTGHRAMHKLIWAGLSLALIAIATIAAIERLLADQDLARLKSQVEELHRQLYPVRRSGPEILRTGSQSTRVT